MGILPEMRTDGPALDRETEGLAREAMGKPAQSMAHGGNSGGGA